MNLSNVSNIRFSGTDVKLAKIDGVIIYRKDEEDVLLLARYTANASGVLPTFNDTFEGYETEEVNNDGIYTVTIRTNKEDNLPTKISFVNNTSLLTVEYLKVTSNITATHQMFQGCSSLTTLDVSNWDTSNVITMHQMFQGCSSLTTLDVSNWDTSNATTMGYLFYNCTNLTSLDLSNFNTSKVTSMVQMFQGCKKLTSLDVSNLDTSKIADMRYMFSGCNKLTSLDLSSFNTSKATNMTYMFQQCNNLTSLDLSNFDTSNVTSMQNMFDGCNLLTSLDSMMNIATDLSLPSSLNQESVLDVMDNLATVTATKTLKMSATQLSWVPTDKIIEANNKGWSISA